MINFTPPPIEELALSGNGLSESCLFDITHVLEDNKVPCDYVSKNGKRCNVHLIRREDYVDNRGAGLPQRFHAVILRMAFSGTPTDVKIYFFERGSQTCIHGVDFAGQGFEPEKESKLNTEQLKNIVGSILGLPHWGYLEPKSLIMLGEKKDTSESCEKKEAPKEVYIDEDLRKKHLDGTKIEGDTLYYYFFQNTGFFRYVVNFEIIEGKNRRVGLDKGIFEKGTDRDGFGEVKSMETFDMADVRSRASIEVFMRVIAPTIDQKQEALSEREENKQDSTSPAGLTNPEEGISGEDDNEDITSVIETAIELKLSTESYPEEINLKISKISGGKGEKSGKVEIKKGENTYIIHYDIEVQGGHWQVVPDDTEEIFVNLTGRSMGIFSSEDKNEIDQFIRRTYYG